MNVPGRHDEIGYCFPPELVVRAQEASSGSMNAKRWIYSGVHRRENASESREFHPATQLRPTCSKFILLLPSAYSFEAHPGSSTRRFDAAPPRARLIAAGRPG
jgi:hypothetical protein